MSLDIEAERKLFETWAAKHVYNIDRTEMTLPARFYVSVQTEGYWNIWQARATLDKSKAVTAWRGLWDTQWMNIVNHDHAFQDYSKDDAVHLAVKMTENKLKENNALPAAPVLSDEISDLLETIDIKCSGGLCCLDHGSTREFLKEIRALLAKVTKP